MSEQKVWYWLGSVLIQRDSYCTNYCRNTLNYTDNPEGLQKQLVSIQRVQVISATFCLLFCLIHFDISFLISFLSPACPVLTLDFGMLSEQWKGILACGLGSKVVIALRVTVDLCPATKKRIKRWQTASLLTLILRTAISRCYFYEYVVKHNIIIWTN